VDTTVDSTLHPSDKIKARRDAIVSCMVVLAVLLVDQAIKIWVKTNMSLGECFDITSWFKIAFIENNGMAYGVTFINKLFLSLFRVVAVAALIWYIRKLLAMAHRTSYVVCLSFILAGAVGNIIDSLFYGLIFSQSTPFTVAQLVPWGEGYAGLFYGKVVDMFYFPLIVTTWPDWMPMWGGEEFIFFSPIFNFADSCITCGIFALIVFFRRELEELDEVLFGNSKWYKKRKEQNSGEAGK